MQRGERWPGQVPRATLSKPTPAPHRAGDTASPAPRGLLGGCGRGDGAPWRGEGHHCPHAAEGTSSHSGILSWPVVTRCPRCLHLPAQAGGRGHVLSLAGVSFSPSQEAEATPPSSEPRPPHCLQAAEQAPTPMQQSQPPSPGTGAGRVQAAQAAHEHAPPQENTPRIRSFTLTQRGRWGHRGGCDTHTRGDNGNKYGVGVARAGPRAPWPEPVPTPQPPP